MNRLIRESFLKAGYDSAYLSYILRETYGHVMVGEGDLVTAINGHRMRGEVVTIFPDFDMDGIAAGCILYAGLSLFGVKAHLFAPDASGAYGMSFGDADRLLYEFPDTKAVLTCDTGIAERESVRYLKQKGVRVYVTDHHPEPAKGSARGVADAVVDPASAKKPEPFIGVCGAFVAQHVIELFAALDGDAEKARLARKLRLFAGLGSVGDSMPMVCDTRRVVRDSVKEFNALLDCENIDDYFETDAAGLPDAFAAPFENLRALHFFLLRQGIAKCGDVTDETYAFLYCPLFNSVKRLGLDMGKLYRLLYTRFGEKRDGERLVLCQWLADANEVRKATVRSYAKQLAEDRHQQFAPYIYLIDAQAGLLGPLANKMTEASGEPCLVLRPVGAVMYAGSGRTPDWFSRDGIEWPAGTSFDGHEHAFGARVRGNYLGAVYGRLKTAADAQRPVSAGSPLPEKDLILGIGKVPCDFGLRTTEDYDVCYEYATEIGSFRPFGRGFEEPEFVLAFPGGAVKESRLMGKEQEHLKLVFPYGMEAVWFGGAAFRDRLSEDGVFRLAGTFSINEWGGGASLQFLIRREIRT